MPSKIKLAWDSGELMLEGLEGALAGEGEGDEKVQVSSWSLGYSGRMGELIPLPSRD